jgi:hypothetical protein
VGVGGMCLRIDYGHDRFAEGLGLFCRVAERWGLFEMHLFWLLVHWFWRLSPMGLPQAGSAGSVEDWHVEYSRTWKGDRETHVSGLGDESRIL